MSSSEEKSAEQQVSRQLPDRITIPTISGEMVHLRPATLDDLPKLDELDAYAGASGVTGKDERAERSVVRAWVRRSVAWANGLASSESGVGDPEARRTIAWAVLTDVDHDVDGNVDAAQTDNVIGMAFLIDIDGWSRSARIQVVLGRDYRGRGYSRDTMPRVMTYGFAAEGVGLGLHRIWVAVPEKNTRSLSVYQSLGFVKSGTSRDSLWDAEIGKYQSLIVMDTLVDEYDPIRSLDAFGMRVIEGNPGVREAMAVHEHAARDGKHNASQRDMRDDGASASGGEPVSARGAVAIHGVDANAVADGGGDHADAVGSSQAVQWPRAANHETKSEQAWWRGSERSPSKNGEASPGRATGDNDNGEGRL